MCSSTHSPEATTPPNRTCFMKTMEHPYLTLYCAGCGHQLVVPVYCKNRFCPVCSKRRTKIVRHRMKALFGQIRLTDRYRLSMLTLTMRSMKDPTSMADQIVHCFRRLRQRKVFSRACRGGVYVLEVKQNDQGWHIHIHAVIVADFIPWKWLRRTWQQISGAPGIHIETIPKDRALLYITKYISTVEKGTDAGQAATALRDKRLFQCFGEFHDMLKPYNPPRFPCPRCSSNLWSTFRELGSYDHARDPSKYAPKAIHPS
jgi:hypothetical protein